MCKENETKKPWIDDDMKDQLKQETDLLALLRHFGATEIQATIDTTQFKAKCLFSDCNSKENDYPLGINTSKNVFNCFHCGRNGDVLKLIMLQQNSNFYAAKKFLLEWNRGQINQTYDTADTAKNPAKPISPPETIQPMPKYKPFRRRLTGLRVQDIPILDEKGLLAKTATKFGVGYCSQGFMKGRIVVPLHDSEIADTEDKNILAYAGYSVTRKQKEYGDWKFPDGFEKGKQLFNLNRVTEDKKNARETLERHGIIITESFWNVLKLSQAGITNAVALMGTALTPDQERLLLNITDKIKLWLDTDEAGTKGLQNILRTVKQGGKNGLIYKAHVKIIAPAIESKNKVKPYQFTEDEIKEILGRKH